MAANVNNSKAIELSQATDTVPSLYDVTADPEKQKTQLEELKDLGAKRGNGNNQNLLTYRPENEGDKDVADAQEALQAALAVDSAAAGTSAAPETRIPQEQNKLSFFAKAIAAGENALTKGKSSLKGLISALISSAKQLYGYTVKFIEGLFDRAKSNKEMTKKGHDIATKTS